MPSNNRQKPAVTGTVKSRANRLQNRVGNQKFSDRITQKRDIPSFMVGRRLTYCSQKKYLKVVMNSKCDWVV